MTKPDLGENLAREWEQEPRAPELRSALELIKSNPRQGLEMLAHLAEDGSGLAMFYLGYVYLGGHYGFSKDTKAGEYWLRRSASEGSIEGAFGLALHLLKSGNPDGLAELRRLGDLHYSPALAALGLEYDRGILVKKDLKKSLFYYRLAEKEGHLIAANQISCILMRKDMGLLSWLRGFTKKIRLVVPLIATKVRYPNSDRFSI